MTADSRAPGFDRNVFVNCPFDDEYVPLLRPLLFTILSLGYEPRLASETSDSAEIRLDKICRLVTESRYGIHDLSRLRARSVGEYYRMNMPFELGVDYGCRLVGQGHLRGKRFLVLEADQHEFRKALSDLSGVDIKSHGNDAIRLVRAVRDWFVETVRLQHPPPPSAVWYAFNDFMADFQKERRAEGYTGDDLDMMPIPEYIDWMRAWIKRRS